MTEETLYIDLDTDIEPTEDGNPRTYRVYDYLSREKVEDSTHIWRYLSLEKFVSLLATDCLWFSRLDLLGDPFEGAAPGSDLSSREDPERYSRIWSALRRWHVVNCWHAETFESDAMWKLYTSNGTGIAIHSTIKRLDNSLANSTMHYLDSDPSNSVLLNPIFIGLVKYVEHSRTILEGDFSPTRFFLKRLPYSHEREVRALSVLPELKTPPVFDVDVIPQCSGVNAKVDLSILIEEVVICPTAPQWFRFVVNSVIDKYSLDCPSRNSKMSSAPQY